MNDGGRIVGLLCMLVVAGAFLLTLILMLVWVANDAQRRGQSGCLWVLVILMLHLPGLLLYLAMRPPLRMDEDDEQEFLICRSCGRRRPITAKWCPNCGIRARP
jgi:ribosomal protein L40E